MQTEENIVLVVIEAARIKRGDTRPPHPTRIQGLVEFARDMEVTVTAVQKWVLTGEIPHKRVPRAEEVSGVVRHRIRPDVFPPPRSGRSSVSSSVSVP